MYGKVRILYAICEFGSFKSNENPKKFIVNNEQHKKLHRGEEEHQKKSEHMRNVKNVKRFQSQYFILKPRQMYITGA